MGLPSVVEPNGKRTAHTRLDASAILGSGRYRRRGGFGAFTAVFARLSSCPEDLELGVIDDPTLSAGTVIFGRRPRRRRQHPFAQLHCRTHLFVCVWRLAKDGAMSSRQASSEMRIAREFLSLLIQELTEMEP